MGKRKVRVGKGSTLKFVKAGATFEFLSYSVSDISTTIVETTHMESPDPGGGQYGNRTFTGSGLVDPGTIEATIHMDPDQVPPVGIDDTFVLTIKKDPKDKTASTVSGPGTFQALNWEVPLDDKLTGTLSIKCSAPWTVKPSTSDT